MPSDTESPMYATSVHAVFVGAARAVVDVLVVAAADVTGIEVVRGAAGRVEDGTTNVGVVGRVGSGPSSTVGGTVTTGVPASPAAESPHAVTLTIAAITQHNRRPDTVRTLRDANGRQPHAGDIARSHPTRPSCRSMKFRATIGGHRDRDRPRALQQFRTPHRALTVGAVQSPKDHLRDCIELASADAEATAIAVLAETCLAANGD